MTSAVDHGLAILRVEKFFFLNAEHPLNRLFTREPWIGIPADFWYASLHYMVTPSSWSGSSGPVPCATERPGPG